VTTVDTDGGFAGKIYGELIADQLTQARTIKNSLEQRALAVITTSGTLVTLLFAFTAVTKAVKSLGSGHSQDVPLPELTRYLLGAAVIAFVVAVGVALSVNDARRYHEVDKRGFDQILDQAVWSSPDTTLAARRVAELQADLTLIFANMNNHKAKWLNVSLAFEVIALGLLTLAVLTSLSIG
jgi:hypothetical protein